ncbi:MAG: tRNA lysidine(34) synthetase TilS [Pseudomonadota bacterium]
MSSEAVSILSTQRDNPTQQIEQSINMILQGVLGERNQDPRGSAAPVIYVACSGGLDSSVLLVATVAVAQQIGAEVVALHAQHGIAEAGERWADHVEALCKKLDIRFVTERLQIPSGNLEGNARAARYEFFSRWVGSRDILLLAHHRDDQSETILQRLFSGRGILPIRPQGRVGQGRFYRPFLEMNRQILEAFGAQDSILQSFSDPWVDDPSNLDTTFQRNFIRHELLPRLKSRWPEIDRHLVRVGSQIMGQSSALEHTLAALVDRAIVGERVGIGEYSAGVDGPALARNGGGKKLSLHLLPRSEASAIAWLRALSVVHAGKACSDRSARAFLQELHTPANGVAILKITASHELRSYAGDLYLVQSESAVPAHIQLAQMGPPPVQTPWACGTVEWWMMTEPEPLSVPWHERLVLQPRRGGEVLEQADGWSCPVKKMLARHKIPPWQRDSFPLLYLDEQIVCLPGLWVSEDYAKQALGVSQHLICRYAP